MANRPQTGAVSLLETYLYEALVAHGESAALHRQLARVTWRTRGARHALKHLHRELAACRRSGDDDGAADALLAIAEVLVQLDNGELANRSIVAARRHFYHARDVTGLAITELLRADIVTDPETQTSCLRRALSGLRLAGDLERAAVAWHRLGRLDLDAGRTEPGRVAFINAAGAYARTGELGRATSVLLDLAHRLEEINALDAAAKALDDALTWAEQIEPAKPGLRARIRVRKGRLALALGKEKRALRLFQSAFDDLDRAGASHRRTLAATVGLVGALEAKRSKKASDNGRIELLLGRAFDMYLMQRDRQGLLAIAHALVTRGRETDDLALARRWAVRASEAAAFLPE